MGMKCGVALTLAMILAACTPAAKDADQAGGNDSGGIFGNGNLWGEADNRSSDGEQEASIAPITSADMNAFLSSGNLLVAALKNSVETGLPPRTGEPLYQDFADRAVHIGSAIGTPAMQVIHGRDHEGTCRSAGTIIEGYQLAGAGKVRGQPRAIQQLKAMNTTRFQNELVPLAIFSSHCYAAHVPVLAANYDNFQGNPMEVADRPVLVPFAQGMAKSYGRLVGAILNPEMAAGHKQAAVDEILASSDEVARVLPMTERIDVVRFLDRAYPAVTARQQDALSQVRQTMITAPCQGLCRIVATPGPAQTIVIPPPPRRDLNQRPAAPRAEPNLSRTI